MLQKIYTSVSSLGEANQVISRMNCAGFKLEELSGLPFEDEGPAYSRIMLFFRPSEERNGFLEYDTRTEEDALRN